MRTAYKAIISAGLICCSLGWFALAQAADPSFAQIRRGKALADAGDCVSCHTIIGNKPFAGGRPIETPFGVIYSPNITPDRDSGIGMWSDADFENALHNGVGPDGTRLYPAFPYPYFTKMTHDDVLALRAYLNTLPPVHNQRPDNKLTWPLNYRYVMAGWNMLFFKPGRFIPNTDKSPEWNTGAYLVQGPGHCGACHTPKNALGADSTGEALQGARIQNWFAPNITNDVRLGIGAWSNEEIADYLKTGRNGKSNATALMTEVVTNSTSKMSDADLHAIAVYLKDTGGKAEPVPAKPDEALVGAGKAIYLDSCNSCHGPAGEGVLRMYPPLAMSATTQATDPTTVIRVILQGARTAVTDQQPTPSSMPAYGWKLSDGEVAAAATYVRNAWGNSAPSVPASDVAALRRALVAVTR